MRASDADGLIARAYAGFRRCAYDAARVHYAVDYFTTLTSLRFAAARCFASPADACFTIRYAAATCHDIAATPMPRAAPRQMRVHMLCAFLRRRFTHYAAAADADA